MTRQSNPWLKGLTLSTGLLACSLAFRLYKENKALPPQAILEKAKGDLSSKGKVTGTWIDYQAKEFPYLSDKPLVYYGGASVQSGQSVIYYQFAYDIYDGYLLELTVDKGQKV